MCENTATAKLVKIRAYTFADTFFSGIEKNEKRRKTLLNIIDISYHFRLGLGRPGILVE